jgi:hypothetical protein
MAVTIMAAFEKRTTQMIGGRQAGLGARCGCAGQAGGSATLQVLENSAMTAGSSMLAMIMTCPPQCSQLWNFEAEDALESLPPAQ